MRGTIGRFYRTKLMQKELTELDRLALAARAEVAESSLYLRGWLLGFLAAISVMLVLTSEASLYQTLAVRMFAALTVLSAVTIWLRWRYSLYAAAIVFLALAVGELVFNLDHYTGSFLGWTARASRAALFGCIALRFFRSGAPFAAVRSRGWEWERAQVKQWLTTLTNLGTEEQVFEISTGNFWKGYFTYRFMKR